MSVYTKKQLKNMKQLIAPFEASELAELLGEALGPKEVTNLSKELITLVNYLNNKELQKEYKAEVARLRKEIEESKDDS